MQVPVFLVFHSRNFIIRVVMFVYHRIANTFFSRYFNANLVIVGSAIQNPNSIQIAQNYRSIPIVVRGICTEIAMNFWQWYSFSTFAIRLLLGAMSIWNLYETPNPNNIMELRTIDMDLAFCIRHMFAYDMFALLLAFYLLSHVHSCVFTMNICGDPKFMKIKSLENGTR